MEKFSYNSYPDSTDSSPRSREIDFDNPPPWDDQNHHHHQQTQSYKVKFMCSYNGKIQPRPHDNQLTYVNGETKILSVDRGIRFPVLASKLSAVCDDGGGGGGDDGGFIWLLIELWFRFVFRHPLIGIPLTILILYLLAKAKKKGMLDNARGQAWDTGTTHQRPSGPPPPPPSRNLEAVRSLDPDFSVVLFEDFAYTLYARAHRSRTDPQALAALTPYLGEGVRAQLAQLPPPGVPVTTLPKEARFITLPSLNRSSLIVRAPST